MAEEKIGDWTVGQLVRFLEQTLRESPPTRIPTLTTEELTNTEKLVCTDQIQLTQQQTTVGTAGGASALPATPTGYYRILDFTGTLRLVPYYNA
jgi:hypothetical protein